MIEQKSNILYVRDLTTGKFVPLAALKGADGIVENLSAFSTSERGDSDYLLMTQKGATDILNDIVNGFVTAYKANQADHADTADIAFDLDEVSISTDNNDTVFKIGNKEISHKIHYANRARAADSAETVVWMPSSSDEDFCLAFIDEDGYVSTDNRFTYNPKTNILKVDKIISRLEGDVDGKASTAALADCATEVKFSGDKENESRYIVFADVDSDGNGQLKRSVGFRYNPNTQTLTVSKVKGNVTGTADKATNADHSDTAGHADTAGLADNAGHADKATNDSEGKKLYGRRVVWSAADGTVGDELGNVTIDETGVLIERRAAHETYGSHATFVANEDIYSNDEVTRYLIIEAKEFRTHPMAFNTNEDEVTHTFGTDFGGASGVLEITMSELEPDAESDYAEDCPTRRSITITNNSKYMDITITKIYLES